MLTANTDITAHIYDDFPYVSDTYLRGETDVLTEPVSVVFQ